jgi:hypothetical protein
VLLQLTNSATAVVAWYGLLKAGLIPVCTLAIHRREIEQIGRKSGAVAHLIQADFPSFDLTALAREVAGLLPAMRQLGGLAIKKLASAPNSSWPRTSGRRYRRAFGITTSSRSSATTRSFRRPESRLGTCSTSSGSSRARKALRSRGRPPDVPVRRVQDLRLRVPMPSMRAGMPCSWQIEIRPWPSMRCSGLPMAKSSPGHGWMWPAAASSVIAGHLCVVPRARSAGSRRGGPGAGRGTPRRRLPSPEVRRRWRYGRRPALPAIRPGDQRPN